MAVKKTLMRNKRNSPLEELLEEETQVTARGEEILKDLIKPYAYIGKADKSIHLRDRAFDLPPQTESPTSISNQTCDEASKSDLRCVDFSKRGHRFFSSSRDARGNS